MEEPLDELDEYWTDEQAAEYLGIKPTSVSSWAARHGVDRQMRMKASLVVAGKLAAPGQGRRTDLRKGKDKGKKKPSARDGTTT